MPRIVCILQWILLVAIMVIPFRHSYRSGRITRFQVCFTWVASTLAMLVFAIYAGSLSRPERDEWANYFPDGQHVLGMLIMGGWMNGLIVAALAVGIRRAIRKEPLFAFLNIPK
jgi:hypothetical protein